VDEKDHSNGPSSETLASLFGLVKDVNPLAEVVPTTHCDVPLEWVLDCHAYDHQKAAVKPTPPALDNASSTSSSSSSSSSSAISRGTSSSNSPSNELKPWQAAMSEAAASMPKEGGDAKSLPWHGGHPVGVSSLSLELPGAVVSQPMLEQWLASLLWDEPSSTSTSQGPAAAEASKLPSPAASEAAAPEPASGEMDTSESLSKAPNDEAVKKAAAAPPAAAEHPFGFMAMNVFRMKGVIAISDSREDNDTPPGRASPYKHLLQVKTAAKSE